MSSSILPTSRRSEFGGTTILVALFLLVLMTVAAFAMSKNSLREVIITGTSRQAADVRNVADTGLEWSMYWMADDLTGTRTLPASGSATEALRALKSSLGPDATRAGAPQQLMHTGGELVVSASTNPTRSYALWLTTMGEIELKGTQKNAQQVLDTYNPATLQLWSVRSDAQVAYAGGLAFQHSREAWFTLLPTPANP